MSDVKPREWWILPDGQTVDFVPQHFESVHVIERSAFEKLEAEHLQAIERYRNIKIANVEWTRNDAVTFGKLLTKLHTAKSALEEIKPVRDGETFDVQSLYEWRQSAAVIASEALAALADE